ncbi:site-specific integrase [Roseateles amylovorans]|uniref:Site-specific integrase n=1 Tax=Roseateles amylovorans TaxID=2978473 RepID=A0ABY6AWK3_9BURK|nr:site-specific integrase [Roseateles amylovorans]UXH76206.1 site-specific integrase [Roseateles amylovorans]
MIKRAVKLVLPDVQVVAALDPAALAPLAEDAVNALLAEGESENTVRSYQAALRYWAAWFWFRYAQPIGMPVPVAAVLQFIVDHVERRVAGGLESSLPSAVDQALIACGVKSKPGPLAISTVQHRLSVLSKAHQLKSMTSPVHDPMVRELVAKTRRAYAKRGVTPEKKAALTLEPLQAMLATCDDSLRGVRDRALLLFGWSSGGRRRSEVTAATIENTRKVGPRAYSFTLLHSKTNQSGAARSDAEKPVLDEAADALSCWLRRSGVETGPIFRRIRRGDKVGEPLAAGAVRDIVRERAALAGLPGDFAAHSLRSGFVTEAARQNVSIGDTMALTGHTSPTTLVGYFRAAESQRSAAARLFSPAKPDQNGTAALLTPSNAKAGSRQCGS